MKAINGKIILVLFAVSFLSNNVRAQSAPGTDLKNVDLTEVDCDLQKGAMPFVRWINYGGDYIPEAQYYSIYYGTRTWAWNNKYELFRVQGDGTTCLFQANNHTGAALQFYTIEKKWRASLDNVNSDLYLRSLGKIKIVTNKTHEIATFDNNKFIIYDNMEMTKEDATLRFGLNDAKNSGWIGTISDTGLSFGTAGGVNMYLDHIDADNRGVYIGMERSEAQSIKLDTRKKYNLFVKKGILSEDYAIAPMSSWADFVFNKDYQLKPLHELETYIEKNNHLPDVYSAKQVAEEGYSQHDMNKVLLQKIEELTLYTIQQQKEIEALKMQLQEFK